MFTNGGLFRVQEGVSTTVNPRFENNGLVLVEGGAATFNDAVTITKEFPGSDPLITVSGIYTARKNGVINFNPEPNRVAGSGKKGDPPTEIRGDGDGLPWLENIGGFENATLEAGDTAFVQPEVTFENSSLKVEENSSVTAASIRATGSAVDVCEGAEFLVFGPMISDQTDFTATGGTVELDGPVVVAGGNWNADAMVHVAFGSEVDGTDWRVVSTATFSFGPSNVSIQGESSLSIRESSVFECDGEFVLSGGSLVEIEPSSSVQSGSTQIGIPGEPLSVIGGVIALAHPRGEEPAPPPTLTTSQLDLHGVLRPMSGGIGSFIIEGDLLMRDTAQLEVQTEGPGATDRTEITGIATLDGEVLLSLSPAYSPIIGDRLTVLTAAGGVIGAIDTIIVGGGNPTVRWRPEASATSLELVATCGADLAEPFGLLDLSDITTFIAAFSAQSPDADLDGNGLLDLADLIAFISAFQSGCAAEGDAASAGHPLYDA